MLLRIEQMITTYDKCKWATGLIIFEKVLTISMLVDVA